MNFIDNVLNKITMYRLVLYYLIALLGIAAVFGAFHILPYDPIALLFSTAVLMLVSWLTNELFAKVFDAPTNSESVYITALILALIITPVIPSHIADIPFLIWAAIWGMAAKYIFAFRKKHLFNPAAFAVALAAFTINQSATWWVGGNLPMMAFVVIGGFLIVRKIQRSDLVLAFFGATMITMILTTQGQNPLTTLEKAFLHAPLFFFAFVMLTEPLTTPPTRGTRIAYGAFVGILFAPAIHIGNVYSTPELALLAGNVLSYLLSPKAKYIYALKSKKEVGTGTYDFTFKSGSKANFRPGQYMEWTLGHDKPDTRGNRRYFTIASSPTEQELHLGVKFYDNSSTFKKKMLDLKAGDTIMGGQLAGDFTLPKNKKEKLVFVAGGIGITPFRSMIKYLSDRGEKRDTILLYSNRTIAEIAYREVFDEAEGTIGLKTIYAITGENQNIPASSDDYHEGRIDEALIRNAIPDFRERTFYISGTRGMVITTTDLLKKIHVPDRQIKTDFFPGFA